MLLTLIACGQILQPSLSSELISLKRGDYELDKTHAALLFKVNHMGLSDFVGRIKHFDAELYFDPAAMARSSIKAVIDMASIDVNNKPLEDTLKGNWWLNTDKHPQAIFETTSVKILDSTHAVFIGDLTFLGITKPVEANVQYNGSGINKLNMRYTVGFKIDAVFKRSDFGLDRFIPAIGDDVRIEVHAEFIRI